MLREEVVEAVEAGQFHIWAVQTVDETLEILTGMPAGEMDASRRSRSPIPDGPDAQRIRAGLRQRGQRGVVRDG